MFEKEAEDNKPPYAYCSLNTNCELWKDGFQKGAEFGYNKAKEEMQKNGLALQSDMDKTIEQNIALKKELDKANEWHKGSPKVSMPLILIRYRCHVDNEIYVALGKYDADYGGNKFQSDYWNVFGDEVIAWKEVVLPKEIKENE